MAEAFRNDPCQLHCRAQTTRKDSTHRLGVQKRKEKEWGDEKAAETFEGGLYSRARSSRTLKISAPRTWVGRLKHGGRLIWSAPKPSLPLLVGRLLGDSQPKQSTGQPRSR